MSHFSYIRLYVLKNKSAQLEFGSAHSHSIVSGDHNELILLSKIFFKLKNYRPQIRQKTTLLKLLD